MYKAYEFVNDWFVPAIGAPDIYTFATVVDKTLAFVAVIVGVPKKLKNVPELLLDSTVLVSLKVKLGIEIILPDNTEGDPEYDEPMDNFLAIFTS